MDAQGASGSLGRVLELLSERVGLSFGEARRDDVERCIRAAMVRSGLPPTTGASSYVRLLEEDPRALDQLTADVTVGETYFFRSQAHLETLRSTAIPEILGRRGAEHTIRAWSAGCASGEEAYSLAILFEDMGLGARAEILGTDVSWRAIEKARRGSYGPWSLRGVEPAVVDRHFQRVEDNVYPGKPLRRMVSFGWSNLVGEAGASAVRPGTMDVVMCCNVLIYLDDRGVRRASRRLLEALAPGGWLFTGASDPLLSGAGLDEVMTPSGVVYRRPCEEEKGCGARSSDRHAGAARSRSPSERAARRASARFAGPGARLARAHDAEASAQVEEAKGPEADAIGIRARANRDGAEAAIGDAQDAVRRHPLGAELRFLLAILLAEARRDEEALAAVRQAIYLDPTRAAAHVLLGDVLRRRADRAGAQRAFETAARLSRSGGARR